MYRARTEMLSACCAIQGKDTKYEQNAIVSTQHLSFFISLSAKKLSFAIRTELACNSG